MKVQRRQYVTDRDEKTDHVHDRARARGPWLRLFENLSLTTMSDDGAANWGCAPWDLGPY